MTVVRMTNPLAMNGDQVQELFSRAFKDSKMCSFEGAEEEFLRLVRHASTGVFVGAEKGEFHGLVIVDLPSTRLAPHPTVFHFFNEGSDALRTELIKAAVDFALQAGYTRLWAINATGRPNVAYKKLFEEAGEVEIIGGFMEIKLG